MKKLICVLMALVMLLSFAACGEKEEKSGINDGTVAESETTIFTFTVIHADGEESTSRLSTEKEFLSEALIERTLMTEDMLTVGGEKADPAQNAYWTLYIDGVYATEPWNEIKIEGGSEYMFEYTVDMEAEGDPAVEEELEIPEEIIEEEPVGEEPTEDIIADPT